MNTQYLFLDIDGVLNTINHSNYLTGRGLSDCDKDGAIFDPNAVENLRYILDSVENTWVVLSSTWRFLGMEWVQELWRKRSLPGTVIGLTPILDMVCFKGQGEQGNTYVTHPYGRRGLEIQEWLRRNPKEQGIPYRYTILDDEDDFLSVQSEHVVLTDPYQGITKEIADKVIRILR